MRPAVLALALSSLTPAAYAQCPAGQSSYFTCTVSGAQKRVELCYGAGVASYQYGEINRPPELELSERIETLGYRPWNGIGRNIYEEVWFENGAYSYTVFASFDRQKLGEDGVVEGGIVVTKADQTLADLRCDRGSVNHSLDGFYAHKEAAGLCWDYRNFQWTQSCPAN